MYKKKWVAYIMIVPILVVISVFLFYPFFVNVTNSFFKYESMLDRNPLFVGFNNYKKMFGDPIFYRSLLNTLMLVGLVLIFQVGVSLILALFVNSVVKFQAFYKVTFFMPIVVSATAFGLMFYMFYDFHYGAFNQVLSLLGKEKFFWLDPSNLRRVFLLIVAPVIWQYIGFYFVIFLTGLIGISKEVMEAAEIDGCSGFQKAWYVQLPMLKNVTRTVIILAITGTLKVFDLPHLIAPSGYPGGKNHFLGTYIYYQSFEKSNVGYAAAFAVFIVILGVLMSLVANSIIKENKDLEL